MDSKIRQAAVYFHDRYCGTIKEVGDGMQFVYDTDYVRDGQAISLTLPLQYEPFLSKDLFTFFLGLLPEGWYRQVVCRTCGIDESDEFGLLLATGGDSVGAVSIRLMGGDSDEV